MIESNIKLEENRLLHNWDDLDQFKLDSIEYRWRSLYYLCQAKYNVSSYYWKLAIIAEENGIIARAFIVLSALAVILSWREHIVTSGIFYPLNYLVR